MFLIRDRILKLQNTRFRWPIVGIMAVLEIISLLLYVKSGNAFWWFPAVISAVVLLVYSWGVKRTI